MSEKIDPKDTCVLVTGGAGFIGSHTVVELLQKDYKVVIVDDLSNASAKVEDRIKTIVGPEAAKNLELVIADVNDRAALEQIFDTHTIDRVIHFAGFKAVGESVSKPIEYYSNNIGNTLTLVDVMREHGCKSSSSPAPPPSTATRTPCPSPRPAPRRTPPTPMVGPSG